MFPPWTLNSRIGSSLKKTRLVIYNFSLWEGGTVVSMESHPPLCIIVPPQVEVTRFEDLEETHAEVKMKQNLWDSQRDWQKDYQKWMMVK